MKLACRIAVAVCLTLPLANADLKRDRKSLLDSDPEVVYLEPIFKEPLELKVIKEAPVFSDKEGKHKLGNLKSGQNVRLEAITRKIYRVRGQGTRDGIAGWVTPAAFSSTDPQFVEHLKQLYDRQIQVQALIAEKTAAVGMTLDEVSQALGKPTKTTLRKDGNNESGVWEFIDYEEIKHYISRIDPVTGNVYRQLSHVTREEKSRTAVEFKDNVVTAIEQSEDHRGGNVRIIVPPLIFRW